MTARKNYRAPERRPKGRILTVIFILALTGATATAQEAQPGWLASGGLVAGANPTALGLRGEVAHVTPLYPERDGILWDSAQLTPSIQVLANPTFTDVAAQLYVEPVVFFDLTLAGGMRAFYTFAGLGFVPLAGYDADLPSATGEDFDGENQVGTFFSVTPQVKFAAGPVLGTNAFTAAYYRFAAAGLEYNINWVPAASSGDQPASHRVSAMGVGVFRLRETTVLEGAAFLGSHVNGEPIEATRPFVLTAVSLVRRF